MAKALALAVGGIFTAMLNGLCGDKLNAGVSWFTTRLLGFAVLRLPEDHQERFGEEWASHLNDVPGVSEKLYWRGDASRPPERWLRCCKRVGRR